MAKVQAQVVGGDIKQHDVETISELKAKLQLGNYQAMVNGEPVDDSYELSDYEFVSLSPKVKGAGKKVKSYGKKASKPKATKKATKKSKV